MRQKAHKTSKTWAWVVPENVKVSFSERDARRSRTAIQPPPRTGADESIKPYDSMEDISTTGACENGLDWIGFDLIRLDSILGA